MGADANYRTAAAAFAGMMVTSPSVLSINSLLLAPIANEFGWGRSTAAAGFTISAPIMAAMYLLIGPAIDRYGVRRLLIPGVPLFALSLATHAMLSGSVLQFLLLKVVTAVAAAMVTGIAFGKVITRAFTHNRGLLLGLCLGGGGGLGMTALPLIGNAIQGPLGWRAAYLSMALIVLLIGLPAALSLPADAPSAPLTNGEGSPAASPMRFREALAGRLFRRLLIVTFIAFAVTNGLFAHLAAIAADAGLPNAAGAVSLSLYAATFTVSQFLLGLVLDRTRTPRICALALMVTVAGFILLEMDRTRITLMASAAMVGLGMGTVNGMLPFVLPRYFDAGIFGTLYGWIYAAAALGTGIGPYGMGLTYDHAHSYAPALAVYAMAAAAVGILVLLLPRYRFTPRNDDDRIIGSAADGETPAPLQAGTG